MRSDEDPTSNKLAVRLAHGARVRELEVIGNRLHFVKLAGEGPDSGWVSITIKDKELLTKVELTVFDSEPAGDIAPQVPRSIPLASDLPPRKPGSGAEYDVVAQRGVVRTAPSLTAPLQFGERRGAVVELHEWDETRCWRAVVDRCNRLGWMLLDHPEHGALLRPRGLPFQRDPLNPVGVAAMEGDVRHLEAFVAAGLDVNGPDAGGHTPLMMAARADHPDCVILLLKAGAQASDKTPTGKTAADIAAPGSMQALLFALGLRDFDRMLCMEAVGRLRPDHREWAQRKLEVPLRLQQERLEPERASAAVEAPATAAAELPVGAVAAPESAALLYRVVSKLVPVRSEPSITGEIVSNKKRGDIVIALDHDVSGRWVMVTCDWNDKRSKQVHDTAWILVEHRDAGRLLEPIEA